MAWRLGRVAVGYEDGHRCGGAIGVCGLVRKSVSSCNILVLDIASFQERKQPIEDRPGGRTAPWEIALARRQLLPLRVAIGSGQAKIMEIVLRLRRVGGLAHLLHRGHQQADQHGDDGDHHQKLDERETAPAANGFADHYCVLLKRIKFDEEGTVSFQATGEITIFPSLIISPLDRAPSRKKWCNFRVIPDLAFPRPPRSQTPQFIAKPSFPTPHSSSPSFPNPQSSTPSLSHSCFC